MLRVISCKHAFAIIKRCVENGSEIAKAGKAIHDFTINKDAVQKKALLEGQPRWQ